MYYYHLIHPQISGSFSFFISTFYLHFFILTLQFTARGSDFEFYLTRFIHRLGEHFWNLLQVKFCSLSLNDIISDLFGGVCFPLDILCAYEFDMRICIYVYIHVTKRKLWNCLLSNVHSTNNINYVFEWVIRIPMRFAVKYVVMLK